MSNPCVIYRYAPECRPLSGKDAVFPFEFTSHKSAIDLIRYINGEDTLNNSISLMLYPEAMVDIIEKWRDDSKFRDFYSYSVVPIKTLRDRD